MAWTNGASRTSTAEWKRIRQRAQGSLDYACQHANRGQCAGGLELDHIVNVAQGGADDESNLQWLCKRHHAIKTGQEASGRRGRFQRTPKPPLGAGGT